MCLSAELTIHIRVAWQMVVNEWMLPTIPCDDFTIAHQLLDIAWLIEQFRYADHAIYIQIASMPCQVDHIGHWCAANLHQHF